MNYKKIVVAMLSVLCLSVGAFAEIAPNAIGLRGGSGSFFGGELNYQRAMGSANRLELGLRYGSWNTYRYTFLLGNTGNKYTYFGLAGFYQWHFNLSPSAAKGGFNWYAGPGAIVGMTMWEYYLYGDKQNSGTNMYLNVGGQVGVEYDFNVVNYPFNVSLDSRPTVYINDDDIGFGWDLCFGIRWTF